MARIRKSNPAAYEVYRNPLGRAGRLSRMDDAALGRMRAALLDTEVSSAAFRARFKTNPETARRMLGMIGMGKP